jgi:hypothetical protein
MAESRLVLHRGARPVTPEELAAVPAPPAEGRWRPVPHAEVLRGVKETLAEFGYAVAKERLALSRGDARFFGTLDLETPLVEGVALAVGVRSSIDKSFPLGFCAGSRVFTCDNLAFSAELMVKRKHTTNSQAKFRDDIAQAVGRLSGYRESESARIGRMQAAEVPTEVAESYLLRAFERGILPARILPRAIREWRTPAFEAFREPTFWSLMNALTTALGDTARGDPQRHAVRTMRLVAMLSQDPRLN